MTTKPKLKHLLDVDISIGIAIVLVVYGHLLFDVKHLAWFVDSRKIIYKFHMPLFMFFSGLLMSYTYKPLKDKNEFFKFLKKKINKFFPPYLLFSLIFLFFDYVFYGLTYDQLKETVISTLIYPAKGSAGFLWYVYVLLEFYCVLPLLMFLVNKHPIKLLLFSIAIQFISVPELFNLDLFAFYLLFITLGLVVNKYLDLYYKYLSKLGLIFVLLFIIALVILSYDIKSLPKVVVGLSSVPAVHYVALKLVNLKFGKVMAYFGKHSFYIYLMNTLIMGALFLGFTKGMKINNLEAISPILLVAGLYIPIFIYKKIIRKIPLLNRIIQ